MQPLISPFPFRLFFSSVQLFFLKLPGIKEPKILNFDTQLIFFLGHVEPTARLRDDGERRPGELRRGGRMAGPHRRLRRVRQAG